MDGKILKKNENVYEKSVTSFFKSLRMNCSGPGGQMKPPLVVWSLGE